MNVQDVPPSHCPSHGPGERFEPHFAALSVTGGSSADAASHGTLDECFWEVGHSVVATRRLQLRSETPMSDVPAGCQTLPKPRNSVSWLVCRPCRLP